jgi:hypothetical protein
MSIVRANLGVDGERDVLAFVPAGLLNEQIAARLVSARSP